MRRRRGPWVAPREVVYDLPVMGVLRSEETATALILQDDQVREERENAMAVSESVNPVDLLREQIAGASPDVLQR